MLPQKYRNRILPYLSPHLPKKKTATSRVSPIEKIETPQGVCCRHSRRCSPSRRDLRLARRGRGKKLGDLRVENGGEMNTGKNISSIYHVVDLCWFHGESMVIEPRIFLGSLRYKINQFVENVIWVYGDIPPNHIWVWKWCPKMALEFWGRWFETIKFEATLFLERPNRPTKNLKWNSTVPALKSASLLPNSRVLYWIGGCIPARKIRLWPHTPQFESGTPMHGGVGRSFSYWIWQ